MRYDTGLLNDYGGGFLCRFDPGFVLDFAIKGEKTRVGGM